MASASGCSSVSEESATLTHVRITETADDGMIIEIPNRLLLTWHSQVATKSEYVKLLNESIPGRVVMVKEDASRVAGILATAASRTKSKDRKVRGRERMNLRSGSASIRVFYEESINSSQLLGVVQSLQSTISTQEMHVESLEQLASGQRALANQGRPIQNVGARQRRRKLSELKTTTQRVLWFIETFGLEAEDLTLRCSETGRKISLDLSSNSSADSSSSASTSGFTSSASTSPTSLSSASTSPTSLSPASTSSASTSSASTSSASISSASTSSASTSSASTSSASTSSASTSSASTSSASTSSASTSSASTSTSPTSLSSASSLSVCVSTASSPASCNSAVLQSLYLLDRFGVSDEFYHELSMAFSVLPRSHLLKKARKELNETVEIEAIPLPHRGAFRPFRSMLAAALSVELKDADTLTSPVLVKISGDGARFSKSSSYVLWSFSFPALASNTLAASGNHTFAVLKGSESYEHLSEGLHTLFKDINSLITAGEIVVRDRRIKLEFVLGSDYKFLLMLMGLNDATSNYCCLWCEIHRDDRWNMSMSSHELRTLSSLKRCAELPPAKRLGCKHQPLLNIELHHIVVDILHLMLRITDILIRNLITKMAELDLATRQKGSREHLDKFVSVVRSQGVSFSVWESRDAAGRVQHGMYEWTSLGGTDKLKLLHKLPPLFSNLLPSSLASPVSQLWQDFGRMYSVLCQSSVSTEEANKLQQEAKDWIDLFLSLGKTFEGHGRANVTPYMHIFVHHVPEMLKRFGSLRQFSGQGVEKNNDVAKRNYFSSNKWDAPREILSADARLNILSRTPSCQREKRTYEKRLKEYWDEGGIVAARSARRPRLQ